MSTFRATFVSHAHADNATCDRYVAALKAHGIDIWYDRNNAQNGRLLGSVIQQELQQRPAFVLLLTEAALESFWVDLELQTYLGLMAQERSRLLLPVRLDTCTMPPMLNAFFWIDTQTSSFDKSIADIANALTITPLVTPRSPPQPPLTQWTPPAITPPPGDGSPRGACLRCGTIVDNQFRFCTFCGYDLSGGRAQVDRFLGPNGRPLRCRLAFQNGVLAGRSFLLHQDVTTIGRTTGHDVLILDGTVSLNHARLIFHKGQWSIEDAGSSNGTVVNGQKIKRSRVLHSGDQIRFGQINALFDVVS